MAAIVIPLLGVVSPSDTLVRFVMSYTFKDPIGAFLVDWREEIKTEQRGVSLWVEGVPVVGISNGQMTSYPTGSLYETFVLPLFKGVCPDCRYHLSTCLDLLFRVSLQASYGVEKSTVWPFHTPSSLLFLSRAG